MISMLFAAAFAAQAAGAAVGEETTIAFAGNGGLRDWQAGPPDSSILYVRDRNERWYLVTLSGPCTTDTALDTLTYKTDNSGTFDRFSTISVGRYPGRVCGVTSIKRSTPPPGQPGSAKKG